MVQKDPLLEKAMALMNERLVGVEESLISDFESPENPILFVVGAQRSGTTVLTQALVSLYKISYPSNLIARFWLAPYLGALLGKSLSVNDEKMSFSSNFGATSGIGGPHEFSYFWRHWFPGSANNAKPCSLTTANARLLKKHFAAWQAVNNEPLLFKNLLEVLPNINNLSTLFPSAVFLNIYRDDVFVVQSTYESRKNYSGNHSNWFGIKPSNFEEIMKQEDPLLQSTEQVFYLKKDIQDSLSALPDERYLNISYEEFVSAPEKTINAIENKASIRRWRRNDRSVEDLNLRLGNVLRLTSDQISAIEDHMGKLRENRKHE